jgi:hypothetical protein
VDGLYLNYGTVVLPVVGRYSPEKNTPTTFFYLSALAQIPRLPMALAKIFILYLSAWTYFRQSRQDLVITFFLTFMALIYEKNT